MMVTITGGLARMCREYTSNHLFIDADSECLVDPLHDPWS